MKSTRTPFINWEKIKSASIGLIVLHNAFHKQSSQQICHICWLCSGRNKWKRRKTLSRLWTSEASVGCSWGRISTSIAMHPQCMKVMTSWNINWWYILMTLIVTFYLQTVRDKHRQIHASCLVRNGSWLSHLLHTKLLIITWNFKDTVNYHDTCFLMSTILKSN